METDRTAARAHSKPSWRQLRPQNPPPPLVSATASDFGESFLCLSLSVLCISSVLARGKYSQEYPTGGGNVLFLGGAPDDPGPMLLEHATVRSLRAWSVDATARAIELRPGGSRPADADTDGNPVTAAGVSI